MLFMNDWDLQQARRRFTQDTVPNRLALVMVVDNLREWANENSDGWAYWPLPCRAAKNAMELIQSTAYPEYERRQHEDITDEEMHAAVRPIKAFLTRQKVSAERKELILRAVSS